MATEVHQEICGSKITAISGKLCVELKALEKFGIQVSDGSGKLELHKHLEMLDRQDGLYIPGNSNYTSLQNFFLLMITKTQVTSCSEEARQLLNQFLSELYGLYITNLESLGLTPEDSIEEEFNSADDLKTVTKATNSGRKRKSNKPQSQPQPVPTTPDGKRLRKGDDNGYICKECGSVFRRQAALKKHELTHDVRCEPCGKVFRRVADLNKHKKSVHTAVKPYECPHCERGFTCRVSLERHVRSHTGEKPYQCPKCDKAFASTSGLSQHTDRYHSGGKFRFTCPFCNKGFIAQAQMQLHIRSHTGEKPFTCTFCDRSFARKHKLIVHTRIHTGEKPYTCSTCGKAFSDRGNYLVHTRTHTGKKPYQCLICPKGFHRKPHLLQHMLTHQEGNDTGTIESKGNIKIELREDPASEDPPIEDEDPLPATD